MDSTQGNASSKHFETRIDVHSGDDLPREEHGSKTEEETGSSSSSSDTSSEKDFFQRDASDLGTPMTRPPQHGENGQSASGIITQNGQEGGNSVSKQGVRISEDESMLAGSAQLGQVPMGTPCSPDLSGAKQSPPIQMMGKSDVPEPNRIPSSVFATANNTTAMEWSVASNESLFSIQMGNSSFSRDHVFLLGRSQELGNFASSPLEGMPPIPPSVVPRPVNSEQASGANAEAKNDVLRVAAEGSADKDRTSAEGGPRSSCLSDGSVCSFAFPILTGDGRDHGSIKVGLEPQPMQMEQPQQPPSTETPKAASSATENKWFSCSSLCPFCC